MRGYFLLSMLLLIFVSSCDKEQEQEDEPRLVIKSSSDCITLDKGVKIFFTVEEMEIDFSSISCNYSCTYFKPGMTAERESTSTDMYNRVIGFKDVLVFSNSGNSYTIKMQSNTTRFDEYGHVSKYVIVIAATVDGKNYAEESLSYP